MRCAAIHPLINLRTIGVKVVLAYVEQQEILLSMQIPVGLVSFVQGRLLESATFSESMRCGVD